DARQRRFAPDWRRTFRVPSLAGPIYQLHHLNADLSYSETETPLRLPVGESWLPYEDLLELFELALRAYCLGDGRPAGLGKRPHVLLENLFDLIGDDAGQTSPRGRALLQLLDQRAWCWTRASDSTG